MRTAVQPSSIHCDRRILRPEDWQRICLSLKLSLREVQITQYIFDDEKTECIATELGISVHTVNTYLQRLYFKLDVRSRPKLILRVLGDQFEHLAATCKAGSAVVDRQDPKTAVVPIARRNLLAG